MANTTSTPKTYRAGDRVEVVDAPLYNPHFVGQTGTVWYGDRQGAVVTLDGRGVADTRFANVQLRLAVAR
jgi:hypothetical protein